MQVHAARNVRDPESPQRVVEAAWRAVAARGLEGASVRAIAVEAGVSTGYVTHYFPSKQALLVEVLRFNNLRAAQRVAEQVADRRGLDALDAAIEAVLPFDADRRREWQVWVAAFGSQADGDAPAAGLREGWSGLRRTLRELLAQAVEDGDLDPELDLKYEAERLVAMAAGIGLAAGVQAPSASRGNARQIVADHLAGLSPSGRSAPRRRERPKR